MIGYFGYTVLITYVNVAIAMMGMHFAIGHSIREAMLCLIVCGILDMLDGPVARTKERDDTEKSYGIQIDSLADIICFGVFPVIIGYSIGLTEPVHMALFSLYAVAALIRLGYFNVLAIEMQKNNERNSFYLGLPVTSSSILIPITYAASLFFGFSYAAVYPYLVLAILCAFLAKIKLPKPRLRQMLLFTLVCSPLIYYIWVN